MDVISEIDFWKKVTKLLFGKGYYFFHIIGLKGKERAKFVSIFQNKYLTKKDDATVEMLIYQDLMILFSKTKEHKTQDLSFFKDIRKDNFFINGYLVVDVGSKEKRTYTIKIPKKDKFKLKSKLLKISLEEKKVIIKELNKSFPLMMFGGIREQKNELLSYINEVRRKNQGHKLITIKEANTQYQSKKVIFEDGNYYFREVGK